MIETDYRKCDEIWRRVAPSLEPYPKECAPQKPSGQLIPSENCCMGDAAREGLDALQGFLREAISDAQIYRCLAACAPGQEGRRLMRRLSANATERTRTLQSAYYLIEGRTYCVTVVLPPQPKLPWCDRLRTRYLEEASGGGNYRRAAEETPDVCLKKLFRDLSAQKYRNAELLRKLLARML